MKYCKDYCEEKGISTSELNEIQKTLYYIAENMKMGKSISKEGYEHFQQAIKALEQQPCEDAISRKEALEALEQEEPLVWCDGADEIAAYNQWSSDVDTIKNMPPVQPKYNPDEWCHDCSEYNQDKHCCPRYNKVIRSAVEEMKQPKVGHWILLDECSNSGYYCSECHKKVVKEGWSGTVKKIKYCPNCGSYLGGD